ncbi:MAG TPA: hypothetical protein VFJ82_13285 [Longimicrobium sp.]|nr:hypothetical protein [Longimicrobium sp.]
MLRTRSLAHTGARTLAACAAVLALAACDGGGGGGGVVNPPTPLVVTTAGRLERGGALTVTVTADGQPMAAGSYTLTVDPADAATVAGDQVTLLRATAVTLTATASGRTGKTQVTIAAPPVVVFDRFTGDRNIWRVDLDGQNLTQIQADPGEDQDPTVAQGKVVWLSFRSGNGELYAIPLAGGTTTRLTNTAADESVPALSPDGTRLAYAMAASGVTKVFAANADGTGSARVTPAGTGFDGAIETAPAWTTGSKLAFVTTANGSADIFQTNPGGAAPSLLAGGNTAEVEPAWSADGATLAFVSNRSGSTEIYLMNVATGAVTQLTSGAGTKSQPAWTPDGRVVYLETLNGSRLRWVDPAQPATVHTIDTGTGTVGHPAVTAAP